MSVYLARRGLPASSTAAPAARWRRLTKAC